jgi:DNA-directed RNA polymerase specialized sigma24 family protein
LLKQRSSIEEWERELITSLYPALRRIAAVAGSFDVEPDDLVQEALMQTLRKGPLSDLDNPLAFLRKTIVNLASNQRRSLGRRRKALGRLSFEESKWPTYPADIFTPDYNGSQPRVDPPLSVSSGRTRQPRPGRRAT